MASRLRYTRDDTPGIRRRRAGRGFVYHHPDGRRVADGRTLGRIRGLAVPPAWTDVWICPDPGGHLQATGRDAKGRKQHRYHPVWRAVRDHAKYERLLAFGERLGGLRRRVEADLAGRGLTRDKVLTVVVRLLQVTLIRVGNEEYARRNRSFGLTTFARGRLRGRPPERDRAGAAGAAVADRLGNTATICRKCYVHPAVVDAYLEGRLALRLPRGPDPWLLPQERAVLAFLRRRRQAAAVRAWKPGSLRSESNSGSMRARASV